MLPSLNFKEKLSPIDTTKNAASQLNYDLMTPNRADSNNLLFVENLSEEASAQFHETYLKPYLKNVYSDLAMRSNQLKYFTHSTIDKNCFAEYVNLPGVVSDRFFALASESAHDERVELDNFLKVIVSVYSASLDERMKLIFDMYDFNQDGVITAEEVRMVLSYIPFV